MAESPAKNQELTAEGAENAKKTEWMSVCEILGEEI
jgi:hypothetical protein